MASKLKQLQDRKAAIVRAMRALSDKAADEERPLTEEEQEKFDAHKTELADVERALAREEELQEFERGLSPIEEPESPAATPTPQPLRRQPSDSPGRFANLGENIQAAIRASMPGARPDPRLQPCAATGSNEGIASEGGFLVQTDFRDALLESVFGGTQIISGGAGFGGVTRLPISTSSNSIKIKAVNQTSHADGSRWGGVRAYWVEEGGEKTASKPDFREIELSLKKLAGLWYSTDELLQDAAALTTLIRTAFTEEFSFKLQDGVVNGSGAGQPLGILNASCLISVGAESGQTAATIVKENIDKMWARMWPRGVANSVWLINQNCYPQLFNLHQSVGVGGVPVYLPPGGLSQSPYGSLMGRPVVPIEQCQTLGTKGDILFCDLSQYLLADKGGMQDAISIHVRFIYDETVLRFVLRVDGQPAWASALTPYKGGSSHTIGPFIALDTRS